MSAPCLLRVCSVFAPYKLRVDTEETRMRSRTEWAHPSLKNTYRGTTTLRAVPIAVTPSGMETEVKPVQP